MPLMAATRLGEEVGYIGRPFGLVLYLSYQLAITLGYIHYFLYFLINWNLYFFK